MVSDEITIQERDFLLKDLDLQKKDLFKQTKREPLTLLRQQRIAGSAGIGNVNLEAKRLFGIKKQTRRAGSLQIKKSRKAILERKIKEEPLPPPIIDPIESDLSGFGIDTEVNF